MVKEARERFNKSFSNEKYHELLSEIDLEFPNQIDFRVAESPIFVDKDLKSKLLLAANEIIEGIKKEDFKSKTQRAIPEKYFTADETEFPEVLAIDFAICKNDMQEFEPQLIELQGFPSLFAYQSYLGVKYRKHFDIKKSYTEFFNRYNSKTYHDVMGKFLLNNSKPENTILLEVQPEKQKTRLDFKLTEAYWGIKPLCVSDVKKSGEDLYYEQNGKKIEIQRIYNRLIFDDLERNYNHLKINFNFNESISASWVSHPNWFYRVSKFSMPFLKSKYVPESSFVNELKTIPKDLENYVLKPLFSFAGAGVNVEVEKADIDAIIKPEDFILQKKVHYAPCIKDVNGNFLKAEIRLLYIWHKGHQHPILLTNLSRLSRGKMIGVDFNKDFDWVGGSIAFMDSN